MKSDQDTTQNIEYRSSEIPIGYKLLMKLLYLHHKGIYRDEVLINMNSKLKPRKELKGDNHLDM